MSVLIISPEIIEYAEKIKDYAMKHIMYIDTVKSVLLKKIPPVGGNPEHTFIIPNDYRVVYSVEEQVDAEMYHHLSISLIGREKLLPSVPAVEEIMNLFGMGKNIKNCGKVWVEKNTAVNILKKIRDK